MIDSFSGEYFFLSNFYPCQVYYDGLYFNNSEAAFQAAKCLNIHDRKKFQNLSGKDAKKLGRKVLLRKDWDSIKLDIMHEILLDKFTRNSNLKIKLLNTNTEILQEGNYWHDTYWGVCNGVGQNHLGVILMQIRKELSDERYN